MTVGDPTHLDPIPLPLPRGVTEADLLDWVERRPSSTAGVEAAVRTHPALATWLEEMRVDRAGLGSLPDCPAPSGLLDAVERALERRMLVGLSSGQPLSDEPPVSTVRIASRSPFASIRGDAVGRRLALAAALVLVVGGASVLGVLAMRLTGATTPPVTSRDLALNTGPATETVESIVAPTTPDPGIEVASNPQPPPALEGPVEVAADSPSPEPGMTLARAAELAREGRLIVRVRSRDIDRTLLRFGRIAGEPRTGWRLGEDAPSAVITGLQMERPRLVNPAIEPVWAGADGYAPILPLPMLYFPRIEMERVMPTVFLARVRADESAIKAMLAALGATKVHSAALEETAAPLPSAGPALATDAVLWWTVDPSGWRSWASVPVVVDQAR